MTARRVLGALALAVPLAAGLSACQASQGPAACPSGQQWETVHGTWQCTAIPPDGFVPAIFGYTAPPCPPATLSPGVPAAKPDCKEAGQ